MRALPSIDLSPARTRAHARLLERIYPLYLHELSAFTDYYTLDEHGEWAPDHLPEWLRHELLHPFVVRVDGHPAGLSFVAAAPFPHMASGCDYQVSEFFVLNRYRRRGVGTSAAIATFESFGGRWAVTELLGNQGAQAFWRKVIGDYTGGSFEEWTTEEELIQRFDNG